MANSGQQISQLLQIISNSKLPSELSEQTLISNDSFFSVINTGLADSKKIKLPLLRGYSGDWNASTNTPALVNGSGVSATVYRVGVAGTRDLGNGALTYGVEELIYYNGAKWVKLTQSQISDIVGLQTALDGTVKTTGVQEIAGGKVFTDSINIQEEIPTINFLDPTVPQLGQIKFFGNQHFEFSEKIYLPDSNIEAVQFIGDGSQLTGITAPTASNYIGEEFYIDANSLLRLNTSTYKQPMINYTGGSKVFTLDFEPTQILGVYVGTATLSYLDESNYVYTSPNQLEITSTLTSGDKIKIIYDKFVIQPAQP